MFTACDFNIKFTYVLAGWEGTTFDSRILKNALVRDDPLFIPEDWCIILFVGGEALISPMSTIL